MFSNREELAWVAGFFDGEGCCTFKTNGNKNGYERKYAIITVSQVDPEVLEKCRRITGLGQVGGQYKPKQPNCQPSYRWRIQKFEEVQACIAMIWEWLGTKKREQAKRVLSLHGKLLGKG